MSIVFITHDVLESEVDIVLRFEDVYHLTQVVIEVDYFMIQIFKSLELLFIESVEFPSSNDPIII